MASSQTTTGQPLQDNAPAIAPSRGAPLRTPARYEPVVKCIGLTKVFRDFWLRRRVRAVGGVDLDICRGEVFGLLGPNGSGKSTTIKMILGLLHPTAGRVVVLGKGPGDVKTKKLIGYLPEESHLYPFLNARETLDYYGTLFHQPRRQRRRRIDMLLEMVGLEAVAHRPVGQYSKGMQRRIGLAQALINDPAFLVLDEPTNGLDPIGTRQIKDVILELSQRGKTILLCSHLLADVEDVCGRVAIMFGGKIRTAGSVDELLVQKGVTEILVPDLDAEAIREVKAVLKSHGKHIEAIRMPRRKLESLFLDIVRQAQTEGVATSGARLGSGMAKFLKDKQARDQHPYAVASPPINVEPPQAGVTKLLRNDDLQDAAPLVEDEAQAPSESIEVSSGARTASATPLIHPQPEGLSERDRAPAAGPARPAEPADTQEDTSVIERLVHRDAAPLPSDQLPALDEADQAGSDSVFEAVVKDQTQRIDWEEDETTDQPTDAHASASDDAQPVRSDSVETGLANKPEEPGEMPDQSFLEALNEVAPFDPEDDPEAKS